MGDKQTTIELLSEKINVLLKRQEIFQKDIRQLRNEIEMLKAGVGENESADNQNAELTAETLEHEEAILSSETIKPEQEKKTSLIKPVMPKMPTNFEKFIGENLINKIGVIITVIGISIGAKYAIDHDLINPLTRIILGYLAGIILMGFSYYLRKKYENYSAVLLSGSMAVMYFISYAAYDFYELLPQSVAFILMVLFTAFTVYAAISYNKQVIAHIGLVAAYAVPFLLSDDSGRVEILFSYMSIINIGILVIAFKKSWKPLFYTAFSLTWFIYLAWYITKYSYSSHFVLSLVFLSIIFFTFYLTIILNNISFKKSFQNKEMTFVLINAFVFYAIGYSILDSQNTGSDYLGLFTVVNAIFHFVAAQFIKPRLQLDKKFFYLTSGLVLVFVSLAVPVQLDGKWVTLLWVFLAGALFWVGRTKEIKLYETFGYALVFIGFFSLVHDWLTGYSLSETNSVTPFINVNFFSSIMVVLAYSLINYIDKNKKYTSTLNNRILQNNILKYSLPVLLMVTIYFSFRLEIADIFNRNYIASMINVEGNGDFHSHVFDQDINNFKEIWLAIFNLFFVSLLMIVNLKWIKNKLLGKAGFIISAIAILIFLTSGLVALNRLDESYNQQILAEYFTRDAWNVIIRYFSYLFWLITIYVNFRFVRYETRSNDFKIAMEFIFYGSLLAILSNEVILHYRFTDIEKGYKLGLSILWGLYSLMLIIIGMRRRKKYIRISAISLFGITLLKLFFYDTSDLDTIPKTIIFVSLGVLLLIISFLYNKYKWDIFNE